MRSNSLVVAVLLVIGLAGSARADVDAGLPPAAVLVDAGAPVFSPPPPPSAGSALTATASPTTSGSAVSPVIVTIPAPGAIHDPAENPLEAWSDAKTLQKAGWAALIFGLILMLAKVLVYAPSLAQVPILGAAAAWLSDGKRAVYVAGFAAIAAAAYNALALGGSWVSALFAAGAIALGLVHPTTQPAAVKS